MLSVRAARPPPQSPPPGGTRYRLSESFIQNESLLLFTRHLARDLRGTRDEVPQHPLGRLQIA